MYGVPIAAKSGKTRAAIGRLIGAYARKKTEAKKTKQGRMRQIVEIESVRNECTVQELGSG